MTENNSRSGPVGRRRRANVAGGRKHSHRVLVTPEEEGLLQLRAQAQRVTVPRLLIESTLAARGETSSQRRQAMIELFAQRRLLANVANNINQIARHANTIGEVPPDASAALADLRAMVTKIDGVIDGLAAR